MKGFVRNNQYLSLCGLNCKLCPMNLAGHCSGCGVDNQSCKIAKCSIEHGKIEYCFQCTSFPCDKYAHIDDFDSRCHSCSTHAQGGGLPGTGGSPCGGYYRSWLCSFLRCGSLRRKIWSILPLTVCKRRYSSRFAR